MPSKALADVAPRHRNIVHSETLIPESRVTSWASRASTCPEPHAETLTQFDVEMPDIIEELNHSSELTEAPWPRLNQWSAPVVRVFVTERVRDHIMQASTK
jgi:hypothetical protein